MNFPTGRVGGHAPAGVRWTAPKETTVDIQGGAWLLRDIGRVTHLSLWVKGIKLFDGVPVTPASGSSRNPYDFARMVADQGGDPAVLQDIRVAPGDEIFVQIQGNEFTGVDLTIGGKPPGQVGAPAPGASTEVRAGARHSPAGLPAKQSEQWDLAADFSQDSNPAGPWAYGQVVADAAGRPSLHLFESKEADFDPEDFGPGQPAWHSADPPGSCSLMKSTGTTVVGPEVRFTSGKTLYVEGLVGGQWVGRYRASNGRINFAYWRFAEPAFRIEIKDDPGAADGVLLSKGWRFLDAAEAPRTDRGARHFVVKLVNTIYPINVNVHTLLDGTPVLTRWLEIANASSQSVALTAVAPWAGRLWPAPHPFTLGCDPNPGWVGAFEWKPLAPGIRVVEGNLGNGYDDPFFIVRNDSAGEYFICHMAWSANFRMEFECVNDPSNPRAGLTFAIAPCAKDALRVIAPGETITTPAVHLGHVEGDLDATVQAMHDHIRRSVLPSRPPERAYRIQYSVPADQCYYTLGGYNEANIKKCIDVAAAIGAELFIMDQGWWDVYGEWVPSPARFPHGLEPLLAYAHQKGLQFGLYAEVEGGRGNWSESRVYREHPDWFLPQGLLDLGRPEVADYMEAEFCRLIDRYKPEMYRHDWIPVGGSGPAPFYTMEGPSTLRDGFLENNYWRYYDAYNGVFDRIRAKYPDLILQHCANCGTREDLAMMSRWHETYTVEGGAGAHAIFRPYSGRTLALPPEIIVMGLGTAPQENFDTHLRTMFTLAIPWNLTSAAPSVEELTDQRRERYLRYVQIYQNFIRPLWPTAKVYHHAPVSSRTGTSPGAWFAMEYAAPDRSRGWATIVRLGESDSDSYLFKPRGLDPARTYRVTFDSVGSAAKIEGWQLVRDGLSIRLESIMSSELLLFETL